MVMLGRLLAVFAWLTSAIALLLVDVPWFRVPVWRDLPATAILEDPGHASHKDGATARYAAHTPAAPGPRPVRAKERT